MKSRSLITLAAVVALASVSGFAQSSSILASVPFEFTVGRTVLPAGDYTVQGISSLSRVRFQTTSLDPTAFVAAIRAVRSSAQDQPTLEFHRYGSTYFLARVWWASSTEGLEFPTTKAETELARTAGIRRPERVTLMASR
jgi:hypothetical protein